MAVRLSEHAGAARGAEWGLPQAPLMGGGFLPAFHTQGPPSAPSACRVLPPPSRAFLSVTAGSPGCQPSLRGGREGPPAFHPQGSAFSSLGAVVPGDRAALGGPGKGAGPRWPPPPVQLSLPSPGMGGEWTFGRTCPVLAHRLPGGRGRQTTRPARPFWVRKAPRSPVHTLLDGPSSAALRAVWEQPAGLVQCAPSRLLSSLCHCPRDGP